MDHIGPTELGPTYWEKYVQQDPANGYMRLYCPRALLCVNVTSVELPESVQIIDQTNCFESTTLKRIVIPSSVIKINDGAFSHCVKLEEVIFITPSSLLQIGARAFENCPKLKAISIPPSLQSIGARAFEDCSQLKELRIPPSVTSIGSQGFFGCTGLHVVSFPGWKAYPRYSRRFSANIFTGQSYEVEVDKVEVVDAPNSIIKQLSGVCRGIAKFKDLPDDASGATAVSAFHRAPATFRLRVHYFNPMTAKEDKVKWRTLTPNQKRSVWTTLCVRQAHTRPTNAFNLPVLPHEIWWYILAIVKKTDLARMHPWIAGEYATNYNGEVGRVTIAPNIDDEVELKYAHGKFSGFINTSSLLRNDDQVNQVPSSHKVAIAWSNRGGAGIPNEVDVQVQRGTRNAEL